MAFKTISNQNDLHTLQNNYHPKKIGIGIRFEHLQKARPRDVYFQRVTKNPYNHTLCLYLIVMHQFKLAEFFNQLNFFSVL